MLLAADSPPCPSERLENFLFYWLLESGTLAMSLSRRSITPDDERETVLSAALMTPSSSGRGVRFLEPMHPFPIPFPIMSPTPSPSRGYNSREIIDIVGELYQFGPMEMAQKVLQYLHPLDLVRCLLVSRLWYSAISGDGNLTKKIEDYKKEKAKRKKRPRTLSPENLPQVLLRPTSARPALLNRDMNSNQPATSPLRNSSHNNHFYLPALKRRPCPNCGSLAKVLHHRRAECEACNFDFCGRCFKRYHSDLCKAKEELWGVEHDNGPTRIHIAGNKSKAVKKRLRRL